VTESVCLGGSPEVTDGRGVGSPKVTEGSGSEGNPWPGRRMFHTLMHQPMKPLLYLLTRMQRGKYRIAWTYLDSHSRIYIHRSVDRHHPRQDIDCRSSGRFAGRQ
jgi:hypothetical protein